MLPPQDVSVFLNNALKATHRLAQLDGESPLPEQVRDMPDHVTGHFLELPADAAREMESAWKKIMILNPTEVLYTFTFDRSANAFTAHKR
jgi:hypothetical protein